jgi:hypothetical protein
MEEQNNMQEQNTPVVENVNQVNTTNTPRQQEDAPNATAVLVLGIISIVTSWCYGFLGIILGIIALAISSSSRRAIKLDPNKYTESSVKNLNAGRIMAIIGLSLGAAFILFVILYFMIIGAALMSPAFFN